MQHWLEEVERYGNEHVEKLLIGNKNDLEQHREVPQEEAKAFARSHDLTLIETSAKNANNVSQVLIPSLVLRLSPSGV